MIVLYDTGKINFAVVAASYYLRVDRTASDGIVVGRVYLDLE